MGVMRGYFETLEAICKLLGVEIDQDPVLVEEECCIKIEHLQEMESNRR